MDQMKEEQTAGNALAAQPVPLVGAVSVWAIVGSV